MCKINMIFLCAAKIMSIRRHFCHFLNLHKQISGVEGRYHAGVCPCNVCTDFQNGLSQKNYNPIFFHSLLSRYVCPSGIWRGGNEKNKAALKPVPISRMCEVTQQSKSKIPKIIVFGNIHSDVIGFLAALEHANVISSDLKRAHVSQSSPVRYPIVPLAFGDVADNEIIEEVVVVCCGDMLDSHRPSDYTSYDEGNIHEEIDLLQVIEYLNTLPGLTVVCTSGNHEAMRKEYGNYAAMRKEHNSKKNPKDEYKYKKKSQVEWPVEHLSAYIGCHFPLMIRIGKCVFCHMLPDDMGRFSSLYPEANGNGMQYLNKLFFQYMLSPTAQLQSKEYAAICKVLWNRKIAQSKGCDDLRAFSQFLGIHHGSVYFIGHTKATCPSEIPSESRNCKVNAHVHLCKDSQSKFRVHAMDTHWPVAFKRDDAISQDVNYAVVSHAGGDVVVEPRICHLQLPNRPKSSGFGQMRVFN